jgi:hypothetical protein
MSVDELRSLVLELIENEPGARAEIENENEDEDDDALDEFDTQLTTCRPSKPRTSTLDELIAWLRTAPTPTPQVQALSPKTRRRV